MNRQSGSMLMEMMIGLTVLTVGMMGFMSSFTSSFTTVEETDNRDELRVAMQSVTETLRNADFGALYQTYSGASFEVPYMTEYGYGSSAYIQSTFYVNEQAIPAQFGPVTDLDGDGVKNSTDCSTTYKLLPTRLSLTYMTSSGGTATREVYLLLGDS